MPTHLFSFDMSIIYNIWEQNFLLSWFSCLYFYLVECQYAYEHYGVLFNHCKKYKWHFLLHKTFLSKCIFLCNYLSFVFHQWWKSLNSENWFIYTKYANDSFTSSQCSYNFRNRQTLKPPLFLIFGVLPGLLLNKS